LSWPDDDDFLDVHFVLDVKCTSDDTISVTSKDLQLDPNCPGAATTRPATAALDPLLPAGRLQNGAAA
jgi:hypothetical protein